MTRVKENRGTSSRSYGISDYNRAKFTESKKKRTKETTLIHSSEDLIGADANSMNEYNTHLVPVADGGRCSDMVNFIRRSRKRTAIRSRGIREFRNVEQFNGGVQSR